MHCDESDDPLSRHIETLAFEAQRLGLQGRVNGSHCTSMHSMFSRRWFSRMAINSISGVMMPFRA